MLRLCCNKIDCSFVHSFIHSFLICCFSCLASSNYKWANLSSAECHLAALREKEEEVSRFFPLPSIHSSILSSDRWPWTRTVWRIFIFIFCHCSVYRWVQCSLHDRHIDSTRNCINRSVDLLLNEKRYWLIDLLDHFDYLYICIHRSLHQRRSPSWSNSSGRILPLMSTLNWISSSPEWLWTELRMTGFHLCSSLFNP